MPVWELPVDRWRATLDANLTATFLTARGFLRQLEGDGALILVGSTAGIFGEAGHADYAAAKSAVLGGLLHRRSGGGPCIPRDLGPRHRTDRHGGGRHGRPRRPRIGGGGVLVRRHQYSAGRRSDCRQSLALESRRASARVHSNLNPKNARGAAAWPLLGLL